jgi:membrane protein
MCNTKPSVSFLAQLKSYRKWLDFLGRAFLRDQCLLRASALTYVTALALVPFLAVAFSLSKGLGFHNTLYIRELLERYAAGREQVIQHVLTYINNTNVATLGSIGVAILFISVFSMLSTVEKTLNTIWGIQKPRPLRRKLTDYLSVTLLCPILVIASISITASLQSSLVVQKILNFGLLNSVYVFLLELAPFFMFWLALIFIYLVMPNTRVRLLSALGGAFVAGLLLQGAQKMLIHYQIGFSKYNAIYGSFAQVPLLLIWIYVSWVVVLFGAEISFVIQNRHTVLRQGQWGAFEIQGKQVLALALVGLFARGVLSAGQSLSVEQLSQATRTPLRKVLTVVEALRSAGIVARLDTEEEAESYTLLLCPDRIRICEVLERLEQVGYCEPEPNGAMGIAADWVQRLGRQRREGRDNILLSDLAQKCPDI